MSAFTPYRRSPNDGLMNNGSSEVIRDFPRNELINLPRDLTSILLNLPRFGNRNELERTRESEEERRKRKNEGFLVKNLLRRDDKDREENSRVKNFDDHASRVETLVSNLGKSEDGHRCIYCGKIYSRKYGLKIHVRTHTGYKPLKCKYCSRPFGDPSNLNKHVRLHAQGPTPYKCQFCEKLLVRRRDLERHIKSRHTNTT